MEAPVLGGFPHRDTFVLIVPLQQGHVKMLLHQDLFSLVHSTRHRLRRSPLGRV